MEVHLQLAIDVRALGEDEPLVSRGGGRNARVECVGVRRRQEEIPCADARVVREGRGRVRAPGYAGVRAVFARAGRGCWGGWWGPRELLRDGERGEGAGGVDADMLYECGLVPDGLGVEGWE